MICYDFAEETDASLRDLLIMTHKQNFKMAFSENPFYSEFWHFILLRILKVLPVAEFYYTVLLWRMKEIGPFHAYQDMELAKTDRIPKCAHCVTLFRCFSNFIFYENQNISANRTAPSNGLACFAKGVK